MHHGGGVEHLKGNKRGGKAQADVETGAEMKKAELTARVEANQAG
jgi:hypothetical protein